MARTPALIAACITCLLVSGCTSPTPSAPPSPSPVSPVTTSATPSPSSSPTSTWSADQAAAVAAVAKYRAAIHRIESNPSDFSKADMTAILHKVAGGDVVTANVSSYLDLKKRGLRFDGDTAVVSTIVSKPSKTSFGTEVFVTHCIDQRGLRALDESGAEVSAAKLGYSVPDFNLRQYAVVRPQGRDRFLVYGLAPARGECGP